jgi:uncharacterized protein (TIGR03067 family)
MAAIAIWTSPFLLGMALIMWIVPPPSPRAKAHGPAEKPNQDDRHRLQGNWEGVRVERNGKVVYEGESASQARVRFVGDTVIFDDRAARLEGTFRVIEDRTPKTFDLTVTEGETTATYPAGIYELNGDLFRLCFAFPAAERPTSFQTSPGSGRTLFIYRRTRPRRTSVFDQRLGHHVREPAIGTRLIIAAAFSPGRHRTLDGKKALEVEDSTLRDAGKIGLWSKSDARSYFDDLTVSTPE